MELTDTQLIAFYRQMERLREFDERTGRLAEEGRVPGAVHLYVGEEAVGVGVCGALGRDDYITSTHRGHGHLLAKGGDMNRLMAEIYGRASGSNRGRGGTMHVADKSCNVLGANGIVAAGVPVATGAAFACQYRGAGQVTVCFFGDGATSQGAFTEAANMAAVMRLPLILVCENNLYGESMPYSMIGSLENIADRANGLGFPGVVADGMDVIAVYEAAEQAVDRARRGEGPTLIEAKTYRFYPHLGRRADRRPPEEVASWKARDPIPHYRQRLIERGVFDEDAAERIHAEAIAEVEAAVTFAEASPLPDPSTLLDYVYTEAAAQ